MMTEKQAAFMGRLISQRRLTTEEAERLLELISHHHDTDNDFEISKDHASRIIDWLLEQPFKQEAGPEGSGTDISELAEGRYAVGDVLFLVQKPKAGKWDGWVFVKNASEYAAEERFGTQRPDNTYYGKNTDLLQAIMDDPMAAMQHYGTVTGHCAVCGRTLEDEVSVARGIGPVCWERVA